VVEAMNKHIYKQPKELLWFKDKVCQAKTKDKFASGLRLTIKLLLLNKL